MSFIYKKIWPYADFKRNTSIPSIATITCTNDVMKVFSTDSGETVFSFMGSGVDLADWVSNMSMGTPFDRNGIHDGFDDAAKKFMDSIALTSATSKSPIYFTGHSRGGAIASVAAYRSLQILPDTAKVSCITFGAPRVFSRSMRDEYNSTRINHTRFHIKGDIVTRMPYKVFGFRHVGTLKLIEYTKVPALLMFQKIRRHLSYDNHYVRLMKNEPT